MNDLERDLKELFETKASDVQTTPLAPPAVLRRGRRRQAGTVIGGALMTIAAVAVVIGGASAFLGDRASEPPILGEGDDLPARTATIGGVTVTAPAGWSLLDQSALATVLSTETCVSITEAPAPGGAGSDGEPGATPPADECTPVDLPGGVPLFTLANVEPNPLQTLCPVTPDLTVQGVGPTDAYLYVALDPNPVDPDASWPADLGTGLPDPCGDAEQARWTVDGVGYLAAVAIGPDATQADRDAVLTAFEEVTFYGAPQPSDNAVIGYVVASGVEDGTPWRIEAGANLACSRESDCSVTAQLITTGPDGTEEGAGVLPPIPGTSLLPLSHRVGGRTISFGTAEAQVEAVEIVTTEGQEVTPDAAAWPSPLQAFASATAPIDGTIWWAVVPGVATVDAVLDDGSSVSGGVATASGRPAPTTTSPIEELRLETRREGDELVATTELLGRPTVIRSGPDGVAVEIEGEDPVSFQTTLDTGYRTDIAGGSLALWHQGEGTGPLTVEVDGTGETLVGRWIPFEDAAGGSGRLWILGLPGVGSGLEWWGPDDLASAISWPVERDPAAGVVVAGGDNGEGVAWKIAYADAGCLVVARVDGDPSIGQTECLTPVSDVPLIAHAIGRQRSLLGIVIPDDAHGIYAGDLDAPSIYGQCVQVDRDPAWAGRSVCAILIPNGRTVELQATALTPGAQDETPLGDPIVVRVEDGRLVVEG